MVRGVDIALARTRPAAISDFATATRSTVAMLLVLTPWAKELTAPIKAASDETLCDDHTEGLVTASVRAAGAPFVATSEVLKDGDSGAN